MDNSFQYDKYQQCLGFFLDILRNIETGVILLDLQEQEIIFFNQYANKVLSYMRVAVTFPAIYKMLQDAEDPPDQARGGHIKSKISSRNRVFSSMIYNLAGNSRYLCFFLQDTTDQSRLEAMDEATELMNNIGFVFSGIRHEIGNPINSIKMALTVLQNSFTRFSSDEIETYLQRIYDEVAKMEVLLKSFKHFNMFEKPKTTVVNLLDFIEDFFKLMEADIKGRHIVLDFHLSHEDRWIKVDQRALQHVLMNLIVNALDALSRQDDGHLCLKSHGDGHNVYLTIADNGCGMSTETLANVFKPFYTTKQGGTGLGMAISKKMLSQMNCTIDISSLEGRGTSITLTFPSGMRDDKQTSTLTS